ncbi:helix-turn-helix domain-containing protein [Escherichia coli]|mgnify:FL=1|uniref:AraC-family transcriptional regulator n=2 Tax=Escherichia TaxID=561 RepID=A0A0R5RP75_9ESCH|nr:MULTISPECIES: helix-turn-helix domain-containing protein [Enterobacteriaceae]AIW80295.1 AraC-family transcriptional regulator [uncultured Escherichia sp.]AIW80471.1 AraC-family transcriptional regulator [uncultured bacterium]EIE2797841.1 helix-turn-helix domain-containing protein [Salmonella enterica]EKP6376490.1 helix-turn-helix domain-containing protein [Salmonella enterica subsp. enterica serovar Anatum]EEV5623190.1 helix-turn-helix domain-containing protein [Escherichia coli]
MSLSARVVNDVVQWIENNLDKPLHIQDVAKHAGYSIWYFQRMFTCHQGISLGRYIRERRLNLATQALLTTDMPIYEICLMYGFDSQQAFTRIFHKKFQCSPGLYRKTFREKS